jgi:hypothetical protein
VRENNVGDCSKVVSLSSPGMYDSSERNVCITAILNLSVCSHILATPSLLKLPN